MVASTTHRALRRLVAAVTILVLLVVACSSTDDPESESPADSPATSDAASPSPSPSPSGAAPDEASMNAIASAGIAIVAADGSLAYPADAPATGVELTVDQAVALLTQAEDRSGTPRRSSVLKGAMERRKNLLIGIVVAVDVVAATVYATGLSERLLIPFGTSDEYESSESTTAPALSHGDWINSDPLKLEDLRGRVVLVEFWTFGCINCRNTLPFVKSWHDRYREKGLTVIGVHSPHLLRSE